MLPARRDEKRPVVAWRKFQERLPISAELKAWLMREPEALCIVAGAVSGNLELLDFDSGGELFAAWWDRIPAEVRQRLVIAKTQSGGQHVVYRCESPVCGNLKLAQRRDGATAITLIETRGEGGLFLCSPTPGYELVQGDLCSLPVLTAGEREILLQAAWELNEDWPAACGPTLGPVATGAICGPVGPPAPSDSHTGPHGERPGDDFNQRGDVRALLAKHGWAYVCGDENERWRRPGKDAGWSATLKGRVFYVFSSNAVPFQPSQAYAPFSVYALLEHGGDFEQAARALRGAGYGSDSLAGNARGVDISAIVGDCSAESSDSGDSRPEMSDPGPIPEHLFRVPGFVERVMDFTLANAPYPNIGLSFCGALALQSYLSGRKVCDSGDLRGNIYLLALASSGTGKDFPRKVNSRVLFETNQVGALGDKFASGEGIQDALLRSPAMLFQNDEMDGVLRQINMDRESKRESIPNILLTIFTSANDVYAMRVKAGEKEARHIDQPHLTIFGTATPQYFYESLCRRMLTNGFFARLIIVDIGRRGKGQSSGSARHLPEDILQTARWWSEFQPGTRAGNLLDLHPEPRVVAYTPEALVAIEELQRQTEDEYDLAHDRGDEVAKVAWSRTCENAKKLALLRACSENHEDPVISLDAVEWAREFATHQTRRQLFLAASYVAENSFHAECLKLLRTLREAGGQMPRRLLMRTMRCKAADFDQIVATLLQQGDIAAVEIPTKTRPAQGFQIT